jgi:hypothetical protein
VRGNWAELSGEDYLAQIRHIVKDLDQVLGLGFPEARLSRLTVYSSRNLDFAEVLDRHPAVKSELPRIQSKIRRGEGFLLEILDAEEPAYVIYLQDASVNQAAEEATHYLNAVLRGPLAARSGCPPPRSARSSAPDRVATRSTGGPATRRIPTTSNG